MGWQRTAYGALGWKPKHFWAATLTEFLSAVDGWGVANGVQPKLAPPSDDELEKLAMRYG
ncbi:phage tail assembly chaperone [Rhizobium oryziradicis]|uniref:phage tail assembly chaperone n=1 Tax=Rhizobium oryziradicis TaxID=1867956 RepID=UPI00094F90C9